MTSTYILQHRHEDPRRLALQSHPEGVDMKYALEQIAGWQAARHKIPEWAETEGIIYPPHISMEQCSSQSTAIYKRSVAARLLGDGAESMVDLTGGYGVDFSYIAREFRRAVYVERQEELCTTARHNLPLLGLGRAEVVCGDGVEYLRSMDHVSMVFLDPARRDSNGGRTYGIADCTPDVMAIGPLLRVKADVVMIKLSPMLDFHKVLEDLHGVSEIHIVSVKNECKDLLVVIDNRRNGAGGTGNDGSMAAPDTTPDTEIFCVNCLDADGLASAVSFSMAEAQDDMLSDEAPAGGAPRYADPQQGQYLYEPNASVMKAGHLGMAMVSRKYGAVQVARNSNLFVSPSHIASFPGRQFCIRAVTGMNKKELRQALSSTDKANITTRNFSLSVADLRKRLKLKDGGATYIFATTLRDGSHKLLVCEAAKV